SIRT
ncbi:ABC transporter family protein, partial [Vibrio parahaemolyticus V-223/04]